MTNEFNAEGKLPLNTAIGDRWLCAWQPVRGIVWVQKEFDSGSGSYDELAGRPSLP